MLKISIEYTKTHNQSTKYNIYCTKNTKYFKLFSNIVIYSPIEIFLIAIDDKIKPTTWECGNWEDIVAAKGNKQVK